MAVITSDRHGRADVGISAVEAWLWTIAALVFAMIVVGGATRLTDSGLSITEWKPILGIIPPLTHGDWLDAFEKYKQIPEYHLVNQGMSLSDFEFIYWWEWSHRFLGRIIGLVVALPLIAFWLMGRISTSRLPRFLALFALGGLQGAIGWYMVSSGLIDRVDVSQYRLALHLTTAFVIFAVVVWLALDEGFARREQTFARMSGSFAVPALLLGLILLQVVLGAFVAGLKAGLVYNTWPLMNGQVIPDGIGHLSPWYLNLFENATAVQFNHRLIAYVVAAAVFARLIFVLRSSTVASRVRSSVIALGAMVSIQIGLGIWTLLLGVPLWLGLAHQGGAALVLAAAVWHLHAAATSVPA